MSGQANRRHPETPSYRCFLSDLTGFAGLRRAGPTRTAVRIPDVGGDVNREIKKTRNKKQKQETKAEALWMEYGR
jgi:hypothetical protein